MYVLNGHIVAIIYALAPSLKHTHAHHTPRERRLAHNWIGNNVCGIMYSRACRVPCVLAIIVMDPSSGLIQSGLYLPDMAGSPVIFFSLRVM